MDWPHQIRAHAEVTSAIDAGQNALCVTGPTGAGKSRIMTNLILWAKDNGKRTALYTNRILLREQMHRILASAGIMCGLRASGFKPDPYWPVQLCSIQTELSRVYRNKSWEPTNADLVLIDEAHSNAADGAEQIIDHHKSVGAAVVGFTATPIDLAHLYDRLIVAGTNSELRSCGAHVKCFTYGPDEPDARALKTRTKTGDYPEGEVRKAIMTPTIFARVLDHWKQLNPDGKPTILFAPGVKESLWFAEQFRKAGITAAHIDGGDISYGETTGEGKDQESVTERSTRENREAIIAGSKSGAIKILCNRFVLREGLDCPWLAHSIFATVFGGLGSYLQAGGRLLRAYPGLSSVTVQDHGGNWHRHGSLNADRVWDLTYSPNVYSGLREMGMREKKEPEPICCPKCGMIRIAGMECKSCGFRISKKSRVVVQTDGTLKEMTGDIYKPRRVARYENTEKLWEQMYHRSRTEKGDRSFVAAEALFFHENKYWPPRTLAFMPTNDLDWFRKVRDVPRDSLTQPAYDPQRTFA